VFLFQVAEGAQENKSTVRRNFRVSLLHHLPWKWSL
jgi:hypothetical protein